VPAHWNPFLYYTGVIILVGGFIVGTVYALRARREAREGVDFTDEAQMLSEFQRAREAGEMDEAEFRRVRDLLINGKGARGGGDHQAVPKPASEEAPAPDRPQQPLEPDTPE